MAGPENANYKGWWNDIENGRGGIYYGTGGASDPVEVLRVTGSGVTPLVDQFIGDGNGLIVGHTAQLTISNGDGSTNLTPGVQIIGTAKADSSLLLASFNTTNDNTVSPVLAFLKSGNGTVGSNTVVASGEVLGAIVAFGDDGTDYESPAAAIRFEVDSTPGTGDMPGRIVMLATADGSETLTEYFRLANSGLITLPNDNSVLVVGHTARVAVSTDGSADLNPHLQVLGTANNDASLLIGIWSASATNAPSLNFVKSRHATLGSNTTVNSGDTLAVIRFLGADGTDFESVGATIAAFVDGTPGAGDMPTRLVFATSADGAESPSEAMRIDSSQAVTLGVAGTRLGVLKFSGNTSGTVTMNTAAEAGTWTFTLPADDGDAGEQLQTNGSGVTTWEAAGSLPDFKIVVGEIAPEEGLRRILSAPVSRWHYKPGRYDEQGRKMSTTGDFETEYVGVMADSAPWAMHHKGRIFSPVSAFGHASLAIQALHKEFEGLKAEVAALGGGKGKKEKAA